MRAESSEQRAERREGMRGAKTHLCVDVAAPDLSVVHLLVARREILVL
jgi:hypothetical protein